MMLLSVQDFTGSKSTYRVMLACEQALCLGKGWKNREEREGKGLDPLRNQKNLRIMNFKLIQNEY